MIIIDGGGRILFANRQVTKLFGYSREELANQKVESLLPERYRERHVGHRQRFGESLRTRPMGIGLDLFARRKDGTEFPVEISLSPINDAGTVLVAAAIRDVTDRMQAEQELKEARTLADRANQAKSRFLATASHDLRQPLQTLSLLNGALRRLIGDPDALDAVGQQELAIDAMSQLLNALLDVSKLESGAIHPQITDFRVGSFFEELRAEFSSAAAAKGLEFDVESCTECAHSDPALVGQVLRNLVSNAIKYTNHGSVQLRCRRVGETLRVDVCDTGVGIPPDQLDHIYDEFYQIVPPEGTGRDGYGLGLSIVRHIVRLLDLKIAVSSVPGEGSTFSVTLPSGSAAGVVSPALKAREARADSASKRKRHILLVEDDPSVRNATRMLLTVAGYRVTTAATIAEAGDHARLSDDIELIVSDYHLDDGETGINAIALVRSFRGPELKAILVTGDTSGSMREMQRDGLMQIASKPIDADQLLSMIARMLETK
jgi:PAS domain S-box-containing protein